MKPHSSWISGLAVSVAALAASLALGEVAVRAVLKEQTALFPRYHTDFQYGRYTLRGIRPESEFVHTSVDGSWRFVTNKKGFRNERDFAYQKEKDTIRVLALGDSHTQGYEVRQEATFAAVIERYLSGRGRSAEVINAGVSGFSTAEELAFLENEGHKYAPDVVVVGFYANDFSDNLKAGLFALDEKGGLKEKSFQHIPGVKIQNAIYSTPGVRWLSENSYFYNVVFNGVWVYFKEKLRKETVEYAVGSKDSTTGEEVKLALALFERMQKFCTERGIRLIVVDIPERPAQYRFASSLPEAMKKGLAALKIEVIESEKLLGALDGAAEFHVPNGHQHISELTHALIGAAVGKRILGDAADGGKALLVRNP